MRSTFSTLSTAVICLVIAGCTPKQARKETGNKGPKLDVHGDWSDPENDYNNGKKSLRKDLRAATRNDRAQVVVFQNATILTANGKRFDRGTLVLNKGAITYVGKARTSVPKNATVIDAKGKFITPGIIDTHSHIGVYSSPGVRAHSDGNEATKPITAEVRAKYGYWPQDPSVSRARAGGITSAQILPGSANLIGGMGYTIVMRPGRSAAAVKFPGAPPTIKMACGENPKRVYGSKGGPRTRMGVYTAFRAIFHKAAAYNAKLTAYKRQRTLWLKKRVRAKELNAQAAAKHKGKRKAKQVKPEKAPERPPMDLQLENLAAVLRGEVHVQIHCYKASEIREMVTIANEFGFKIRSFHHALGAYKVRDILVKNDIAISTWADWWGFKMEAFDGIPHNAALFAQAGGRSVIHSDSAIGIQRLNQEAAKAMWSGRHAGIKISENEALRWVTANPAWVLGIDKVTGTLEVGKRADVVLWSKHPFSVYALPDVVVQAGEITYKRIKGLVPSDFELGNSALSNGANR